MIRFFSVIFLISLSTIHSSNGQEIKRNTLYLEAGGASFFYSINYDRLIGINEYNYFAVRIGGMYLNTFNDNQRVFRGIPISFSYLKKMNKNFLEFGISAAAIEDSYYPDFSDSFGNSGISTELYEDNIFIGSLRLGMRHQSNSNRLFWNALLQFSVVVVGPNRPFEVSTIPLPSLGIGYSI